LQALTLAFTSKIASASFWVAFTSLVVPFPFPRWDGYIAFVSLTAYLRQRRYGLPASSPLATPVPVPTFVPGKVRGPINQYKRRDNISDLHFKLGTEYHQENKFDDAIARYRQALENDKNFGPAYVNLGLAYLGKGKRREAIHAFRGAVQFSDDQKSKQEAWYQLHRLSAVSPVDNNADEDMVELGAIPWTDTKPRPNWLALSFGALLITVAALSFYSYLFSGLVKLIEG
jgi:tetratricopeptide (TPR) repeat protein